MYQRFELGRRGGRGTSSIRTCWPWAHDAGPDEDRHWRDQGGPGAHGEATIAAVNGELSPIMTGQTYCWTSRDVTDYQRASDWSGGDPD